MSSHTPGPWIVDSQPEGTHKIRHNGPYGHSVVALVPPAEGWSLLHQDHNARLIAAAPELLEAVKALLADNERAYPADLGNVAAAAARAAIAKAEGR